MSCSHGLCFQHQGKERSQRLQGLPLEESRRQMCVRSLANNSLEVSPVPLHPLALVAPSWTFLHAKVQAAGWWATTQVMAFVLMKTLLKRKCHESATSLAMNSIARAFSCSRAQRPLPDATQKRQDGDVKPNSSW